MTASAVGIENTSEQRIDRPVLMLGTKLNELDKLDALGDDRALGQTRQMSDLVDVDWNAAISSYTMQQSSTSGLL